MPDPIVKFEAAFEEGSSWDPDDSNALTMASQRAQDVWEARHDADGYHTRDPVIGIESAFVHWDGANYSITETTGDSTISIAGNPAVGFVEINVGTAFSNTHYAVMVDVWPSGSEKVYYFEDSAFAKTATAVQIAMFNDTGNFVDRDFMVHLLGTRL